MNLPGTQTVATGSKTAISGVSITDAWAGQTPGNLAVTVSAADGTIAERLKATGQVINVGGPKEFADAIEEQRTKVAATVKAINFKPKQ